MLNGLERLSLLALATGMVAIPAKSHAQTLTTGAFPGEQRRPAEGDAGVHDIIVTASRRQEKLQNVPVSVTALPAAALAAANITATSQLPRLTPGLYFSQNATTAQFTIRGVTARAAFAGDESNIALYVDGIYQPSPLANNFDLLGIDRIEVLRGPQGTLFGRNTTGGLISIVTRDPEFAPHADIDLSYGNFSAMQARAYVNVPLTDAFAFNISGSAYNDNGYIKDLLHGGTIGDRNAQTVRGKLLFRPSGVAHFILTGSYTASSDPTAILYQPFKGNTVAESSPGAIIPTKPWQVALDSVPFNHVHQADVALRSAFDFDSVSLETSTDYQVNRTDNFTDNDSSGLNVSSISSHQIDYDFSQEARIFSKDSGRFQWTAGLFGFNQISLYRPLTIFSGPLNVYQQTARNRTSSVAAFGEGTFAITPKLKLTLGGRYSWEQRHFAFVERTLGSDGYSTLTGNATKNFYSFTPRATVQYIFSPRFNVYATFSRGEKSGLFNTSTASLVPVNPEKLSSFEVGFKSRPVTWITFNASGFHYDYRDIQVTTRNASNASSYTNAGKATIYGGEAEVQVIPIQRLEINAGLSLLHTRIDAFPNAVLTIPLPTGGNALVNDVLGSVVGKDLVRSPSMTLNASINYSHDTAFGSIGGSAAVYHSAHLFFNYQNRTEQPAYTTLSGQLWIEPTPTLRVSIYGDNLTNKAVLNAVLDASTADHATYIRPRSYGVRVAYHY